MAKKKLKIIDFFIFEKQFTKKNIGSNTTRKKKYIYIYIYIKSLARSYCEKIKRQKDKKKTKEAEDDLHRCGPICKLNIKLPLNIMCG
jgi:hypothetical protein